LRAAPDITTASSTTTLRGEFLYFLKGAALRAAAGLAAAFGPPIPYGLAPFGAGGRGPAG